MTRSSFVGRLSLGVAVRKSNLRIFQILWALVWVGFAAAPTAVAATITATGPDSLFPTDAEVVGGTPTTPGPFGQTAVTSMEQSFQATSPFTLNRIYLISTTASLPNKTADLTIFQVSDTHATSTPATPAAGDILLSDTFTVGPTAGGRILEITLDNGLPLAANVGTAGYVLRISNNSAFVWQRTGATAGSVYPGGAAYTNNAEISGGRDYYFALSSVPEPGAAFLAATGSLALLIRRRRTVDCFHV